jgi:hypothetical protein
VHLLGLLTLSPQNAGRPPANPRPFTGPARGLPPCNSSIKGTFEPTVVVCPPLLFLRFIQSTQTSRVVELTEATFLVPRMVWRGKGGGYPLRGIFGRSGPKSFPDRGKAARRLFGATQLMPFHHPISAGGVSHISPISAISAPISAPPLTQRRGAHCGQAPAAHPVSHDFGRWKCQQPRFSAISPAPLLLPLPPASSADPDP